MSLTYGYDLKDDDKILEAPVQAGEIMSPLLLPGGALVNHLSFCALFNFIRFPVTVPHAISSAVYPFMGPIPQLRTIGANS